MELQEAVERVTRDVTAAVTEVVTAAERRLADQAQKHRDELIGQSQRHRNELTAVIGAEITTSITAAERRLAHQAQVNVEAVKSQSKLAAEGYAATLDSINRRLDDLDAKVGPKLTDHDAILKNHADRIQALEHRDG